MKKIITIIAIVAGLFAVHASTPQQRLDGAKVKLELAKAAYEYASTNSTSKVEIEKAEKNYKNAKAEHETATEEFELLQKWGLETFSSDDCLFATTDRYGRNKNIYFSHWFTSKDEALNIITINGIKQEKDSKKKLTLVVQYLDEGGDVIK